MSTPAIQSLRAEGRQAHAEGKTTRDLPYKGEGAKAHEWLHGWWGAFYEQQDRDIAAIMRWLDENITAIYSEDHCKAIAEIIVRSHPYDRTKPLDIKLGGLSFTIPAPAGLKG